MGYCEKHKVVHSYGCEACNAEVVATITATVAAKKACAESALDNYRRATDFSVWRRDTLEQLCREAVDKVHELTARIAELEKAKP